MPTKLKRKLVKVHTTGPIRRRIVVDRENFQEHGETAHGTWTRNRCHLTFADFNGRIEVYVDLEAIEKHYAQVAFENKRRRFVRGPIEVRAVELAEVPGTREKETR